MSGRTAAAIVALAAVAAVGTFLLLLWADGGAP